MSMVTNARYFAVFSLLRLILAVTDLDKRNAIQELFVKYQLIRQLENAASTLAKTALMLEETTPALVDAVSSFNGATSILLETTTMLKETMLKETMLVFAEATVSLKYKAPGLAACVRKSILIHKEAMLMSEDFPKAT